MGDKLVLYVEDDPHNFLLVKRALEAMGGVQVQQALDGEQGLQLIGQLHPDLVLVDIQLPGMDGLELTRRLKADEQVRNVPVVALTANVMRGERQRALQAGCADFVAKPFNLGEFRKLVAAYLEDENGDC